MQRSRGVPIRPTSAGNDDYRRGSRSSDLSLKLLETVAAHGAPALSASTSIEARIAGKAWRSSVAPSVGSVTVERSTAGFVDLVWGRVRRSGFKNARPEWGIMVPPPPRDDERDPVLERPFRQELAARTNITDYEIIESSPEHVLVKVSEQTADGESHRVLYRIQHEPRPDGTEDIHWVRLGRVVEDDSRDDLDNSGSSP